MNKKVYNKDRSSQRTSDNTDPLSVDKLRALIISCWVLLIICFIIKLFGNNWFEFMVTSQAFIDVCNYIDNSWAKYIISSIAYISSGYLIYLSMTQQKIGKDWWVIILFAPCSYLKANHTIVGLIIDVITIILLPLFRTKFKKWKSIGLGIILIFVFQAISLVTKNLGWYLKGESVLTGFLISFDYYSMIALYYLYTQKYLKKEI